jgi:hypothetical protein
MESDTEEGEGAMRRVTWKRGESLKLWRRGLLGLLVLIGCLPRPALAQLDPTCTISIMNRSAQAQPDGSWRIDNVPANFGPVRARATCVRNGLTISGQSEYFRVAANTVTGFDSKILLGSVDPIPATLTVTSPAVALTPAQPTVQLTVMAAYPDGTTADVTAAAVGTTYTISNPAVASLGPNGLLTALTSGTVLISASKDGALGLIQIAIQLSDDSDGDGMPDDYEIANGLDPRNSNLEPIRKRPIPTATACSTATRSTSTTPIRCASTPTATGSPTAWRSRAAAILSIPTASTWDRSSRV